MTTEFIREAVEFLEADRDNRSIRQVIIRAGASKNNRNYPEAVLKQAASLFEGVKTYADHPSKSDMRNRPERSISELTGWIDGVVYDESEKAIIGTRHFTTTAKGKDAWSLAEQVVFENAPATLFGASINALGRGTKNDDGILEVAEITRAVSVDDVTSPAAGGGFEKLIASDGGIVGAILAEATFEEWFESRPDFIKRVQKEMKQVRQTEAVKAAKAEADRLQEMVKQAQAESQRLEEEREATLSKLDKARRELLVVETLHKARGLPAETRKELRARLIDADPDTWDGIIEAKVREVKQLGGKSQTVTTDMPIRRVAESYSRMGGASVKTVDWSKVDTPEKHKQVMDDIQRGILKWQ